MVIAGAGLRAQQIAGNSGRARVGWRGSGATRRPKGKRDSGDGRHWGRRRGKESKAVWHLPCGDAGGAGEIAEWSGATFIAE